MLETQAPGCGTPYVSVFFDRVIALFACIYSFSTTARIAIFSVFNRCSKICLLVTLFFNLLAQATGRVENGQVSALDLGIAMPSVVASQTARLQAPSFMKG
jgi:hypothetical protein